MHFLVRDLSEQPEVPPLPAGFRYRTVRAEDIPERVSIHREVCARPGRPSRVTESSFAQVRAEWPYRESLDCVIEAPDGRFAAYCLCWPDDENRVGEFEPVGVREALRDACVGPQARHSVEKRAAIGLILGCEGGHSDRLRIRHLLIDRVEIPVLERPQRDVHLGDPKGVVAWAVPGSRLGQCSGMTPERLVGVHPWSRAAPPLPRQDARIYAYDDPLSAILLGALSRFGAWGEQVGQTDRQP
jgi:hypothetical protein